MLRLTGAKLSVEAWLNRGQCRICGERFRTCQLCLGDKLDLHQVKQLPRLQTLRALLVVLMCRVDFPTLQFQWTRKTLFQAVQEACPKKTWLPWRMVRNPMMNHK